MKVYEFLNKMDELAPFSSAYDWDNVGLIVGNKDCDVNRVYIALDISDHVITEAARHKCDLILTHHPMIFKPVKTITVDHSVGRYITQLIASGLDCVAMHTNFDVHVMGSIVAERIGFDRYSVLDITEDGKIPLGIGTISDLLEPISLLELAGYVRDAFPLPFVNYYGDPDTVINRVAVVPGSGKSEIRTAIEAGANCLITGDISHHEGLDALGEGLSIIDAGHYGLEHMFVEYMAKYIKKNLPNLTTFTEKTEFPRRIV